MCDKEEERKKERKNREGRKEGRKEGIGAVPTCSVDNRFTTYIFILGNALVKLSFPKFFYKINC